MIKRRPLNVGDQICLLFDQALRALTHNNLNSGKAYPANHIDEVDLTDAERRHSAALMRVNHVGEVCAQALYHGQALVAKSNSMRELMQQAAKEESDHLWWCKKRLEELGSRTSYLNFFWYFHSFLIGAAAGLIADDLSLGFVAETEKQVIRHLESHLQMLQDKDPRTEAILKQMLKDEAAHRDEAMMQGARDLPVSIKTWMRFLSKVMVKTSYWI